MNKKPVDPREYFAGKEIRGYCSNTRLVHQEPDQHARATRQGDDMSDNEKRYEVKDDDASRAKSHLTTAYWETKQQAVLVARLVRACGLFLERIYVIDTTRNFRLHYGSKPHAKVVAIVEANGTVTDPPPLDDASDDDDSSTLRHDLDECVQNVARLTQQMRGVNARLDAMVEGKAKPEQMPQ